MDYEVFVEFRHSQVKSIKFKSTSSLTPSIAATPVSAMSVVSTTQTTSLQWHSQKEIADIAATSHDTDNEILLGTGEAEWSKLLEDQSSLEPAT